MRIRYFTTLSLLGAALVTPSFADKVKLEQLSPELQQKIRSKVGSARIEDIDRDTRNGKTTYEVAFKNAEGKNTEELFEESGIVAAPPANSDLDSRKLTYNELPVPVRRTADSQISGGEVNDVERKVRNGHVTYGIGFKGANGTGPQRELVIDSQGNLLRGGHAASPSAPSASPSVQTIAYTEVPENVRKVAGSHLNHGNVQRVQRRLQNGTTDYTILFKKENGEYQQMVIGDDGHVVSNQMVPASSIGSAGTIQSGGAAQSAPSTSTTDNLRNKIGGFLDKK